MRINKLVAAAAALVAVPFMGLTAQAATCGVASYTVYTTSGFSCDFNGLTFSNMSVSSLGNGVSALGNITPFILGNEFGLSLNYISIATGTLVAQDVAWSYNVAGTFITDAFLALSGSASPPGSGAFVHATETLSNGSTLTLLGPGATTTTFPPIGLLGVIKDQLNYSGIDGIGETTILANAFSLNETPIPGALWLFGSVVAGSAGVTGWRRRRKNAAALAAA